MNWIRPASALLVLLVILLCSGCASRQVPGQKLQSPEQVWNVFRRNYCSTPKGAGLLVKGSLLYTRVEPQRRTNRTIVSMWGDFNGPVRLDVAAGIGKMLAHLREDDTGLLVFYPTENTAYSHGNAVLGATRLGMPFPFSLTELAKVTIGDLSGLVGAQYEQAVPVDGGYLFLMKGSLARSVVVDLFGQPILLEGMSDSAYGSARAWRLDIEKYEDVSNRVALPERLSLTMETGEKGVLRIKSRELKMKRWPAKAMELSLPDSVVRRRLDSVPVPVEKGDIPVVYEDES